MAASDERKPVTVRFADLAGSTELATRHEDVAAHLKGAPLRMLNPNARERAYGENRL